METRAEIQVPHPGIAAVPNTTIGVTDQESLQSYIEGPFGGVVGGAQYPRGGEGRITVF